MNILQSISQNSLVGCARWRTLMWTPPPLETHSKPGHFLLSASGSTQMLINTFMLMRRQHPFITRSKGPVVLRDVCGFAIRKLVACEHSRLADCG